MNIMATRYIIVDFMHRVYTTMVCEPLSVRKEIMGEMRKIDTTIPNYTIKAIYRFSGKGSYPTIVCMEGGCPTRTQYFSPLNPTGKSKDGYKDGRGGLSNSMRDGINLTKGILTDGEVAVGMEPGYEADDYIYSVVLALKQQGIKDPIDIITNDRDLLPLVDDQVSVYIKNPREYNEDNAPRLDGYFQVTPRTWDMYVSYASEYKGFDLPYNTVLLYKMIRGDKADNITCGLKGYGGVKFSKIIATMREAGCPFEYIFRYGMDFDKYMKPLLNTLFTEDEVSTMEFIYKGINLMNVETSNGSPIVMPKMVDLGKLQRALLYFDIHLR